MLICVDLDGTLLDTVPANAASYRAALEELGFTVTDEYYDERCNGGHYTRFLPPLMGGAPSTADVERVHDRKKALYSDFLDAVRPNTALMEILKTMRAAGHDLACVTTGSKQNATEVLEHFGVREWFGLIVTGEDVEKQKPDPEGYRAALARLDRDHDLALRAEEPGAEGLTLAAVLRLLDRGDAAIVPVMLYDAKLAQTFAEKMMENGVYVIGFFYPVVPKGKARIRVQLSAGHTREHLDKAIAAFEKVGKELGVIS